MSTAESCATAPPPQPGSAEPAHTEVAGSAPGSREAPSLSAALSQIFPCVGESQEPALGPGASDAPLAPPPRLRSPVAPRGLHRAV